MPRLTSYSGLRSSSSIFSQKGCLVGEVGGKCAMVGVLQVSENRSL